MNNGDKNIIANVIDPEEARVAILEEGHLVELFAERMWERQRAGEIYKARIDNVLPGINAAFVNLGEEETPLYLDDKKRQRETQWRNSCSSDKSCKKRQRAEGHCSYIFAWKICCIATLRSRGGGFSAH